MTRLLIVTGSSGGHVFPALALAEALDRVAEAWLVLPEKNINNYNLSATVKVKYIPASNLSFKLNLKNLTEFYKFLVGAWESLLIVLKFKPQVIVGFGSLNTVALVIWGWLFRIKTIIHEQNVIPGKANLWLAKLVDRIAVSFPQTGKYLNVNAEKIVFTGNPLRQNMVKLERKQALDFFGFKEGKFNILVTGGSQGAAKLNSVCLEALTASKRLADIQVVHLTGAKDLGDFKNAYAVLGSACKVFEFLPQMQYAYSFADLVICRAGATTIAELMKFKVPAILVPYPFAYAHQQANALILESILAAEVLFDAQLTAQELGKKLETYFLDPDKLLRMRQAYQKIAPIDAMAALAKEVMNLK